MARVRANNASGGGGGNTIEIGTVTLAVGSQTFSWQELTQKPTRFFMYKLHNPVANGDMVHIYDGTISSSVQYVFYNQSSVGGALDSMPTTTNDFIQDIDASWFQTKTSDSRWSGDYFYVAIVD